MLLIKYVNLRHPHSTGASRPLLLQKGLYDTLAVVQANITAPRRGPITVADTFGVVTIDRTKLIQDKIVPEEGYEVAYLNIPYIDEKNKCAAAQSMLYVTQEKAIEVALKIGKSEYNRGMIEEAYDHIGVPVVFKKFAIDPLFTTEWKHLIYENTICEENFANTVV